MQLVSDRFQAGNIDHRNAQFLRGYLEIGPGLLAPRVHLSQHDIFGIMATQDGPRQQFPVARLGQPAQKAAQSFW